MRNRKGAILAPCSLGMGIWGDFCALAGLLVPGLVPEEPPGLYLAEQKRLRPAMGALTGHGYPRTHPVGKIIAFHPNSSGLLLPRQVPSPKGG